MALSLSLTSNFFIHLLLRSPGQVFFKWPLGIWVLAAFVPHGTRWENMGYSLSFYRKHKAKYSRKKLEFTRISFHSILIRFSSVTQSCPTLCDPMNCSTPGLPVHHQLPESTPIHVHWVGDAIQPSHPLSSPSPPALNPSQHQGLFQWVNSSHEVAKVLEFQFQHQSFQWTPRTDLL